jgi:hypothetical protein
MIATTANVLTTLFDQILVGSTISAVTTRASARPVKVQARAVVEVKSRIGLDCIYRETTELFCAQCMTRRAIRRTRRRGAARNRPSRTYRKKDYASGGGMLTAVWGPSMWHYLHTMSFNYPVLPSAEDKRHYRDFILSLRNVLPCRHCRQNLVRNLRAHPLRACDMKNREAYSRYVFYLHERVNKMLGKRSGLTYCEIRERYEHFRARCSQEPKLFKFRKTRRKERGCTEPLYGSKAKCVIKIVPQSDRCKTMQIDRKCLKRRIPPMEVHSSR